MITQKQEYEMHERKRMPSKSMKTIGKNDFRLLS